MTRRFLWALTARLTLAISCDSYSCVGRSATEELLGDLGVARGEDLLLGEAAGAARRLALEVVAKVRLLLHELSAARDLEALLGARVGLLLRHLFIPSFHIPRGRESDPAVRESGGRYSAGA